MIKEALKEALMDLKGQMRGRRASTYTKGSDESHKKGETVKSESDTKHERSESPKELASEGMGELKEMMKGFMAKKRKGKGSGRPLVALKADIAVAAPKKGKGK